MENIFMQKKKLIIFFGHFYTLLIINSNNWQMIVRKSLCAVTFFIFRRVIHKKCVILQPEIPT